MKKNSGLRVPWHLHMICCFLPTSRSVNLQLRKNKQLNCVSNNHFLATLAPEHFLALTDAMQVRL